MGIDVEFSVYCIVSSLYTHTFTTDKPWKELQELVDQGYMILGPRNIENNTASLQKFNVPDNLSIRYYGRLGRFEMLQNLYHSYQEGVYSKWCKWNFNTSVLSNIEDIRSTLLVWDDMWDDIERVAKEDPELYDSHFNHVVRSKMRKILEYAVAQQPSSVQIHTDIHIDY